MKNMFLTTIACLSIFASVSYAEQSAGEKAEVAAKDSARAVKKGAHRVAEKVCMKSDAKCLADKAKHRAQEMKDATGDKASELKNKAD